MGTMMVRLGTMVVVKLDGPVLLCKTDEVGELCLSSNFTGTGYWGLPGVSNASFKVNNIAGMAMCLLGVSHRHMTRAGMRSLALNLR